MLDSLHTLPTDSIMMQIAHNTHHDFVTEDWNLFGWFAFILAVFSFIVAWITYRAQKRTEEHTTNAPKEVQVWKLIDLPRHFYRNLVCTSALIYLHKTEGPEKQRKRYPSEGNLWKLKVLPDDIVLPIDVDKSKKAEDNSYRYMHELKLLLRNYNTEVQAASLHLARKNISDEALKQDFDNLLFKPLNLVQKTYTFERKLHTISEAELQERTVKTMIGEHFKKLSLASNFNLLFSEKAQQCLKDALHLAAEPVDENVTPSKLNLLAMIDKKGGVLRSLAGLKSITLKWEDVLPDVKKDMTDHGKKKDAAKFVEAEEGALDIRHIGSAEDFEAFYRSFFEKDEKKISDKQLTRLYKHLAAYFNYLSQPTLDFSVLLEYILAVDAAIEIDRIGMVNFE